jgi:hypothetical protein
MNPFQVNPLTKLEAIKLVEVPKMVETHERLAKLRPLLAVAQPLPDAPSPSRSRRPVAVLPST